MGVCAQLGATMGVCAVLGVMMGTLVKLGMMLNFAAGVTAMLINKKIESSTQNADNQ